jgi:hypothetical protein
VHLAADHQERLPVEQKGRIAKCKSVLTGLGAYLSGPTYRQQQNDVFKFSHMQFKRIWGYNLSYY